MPYKATWKRLANDVMALSIPGVVIASTVVKGEPRAQHWTNALTPQWWNLAADTAKTREAKGKFAGLILKRGVSTHVAPDIGGHYANLRWETPYARVDMLVTDPEEIGAILRHERTQLSIDGDPATYFVWGVELTRGDEGYFSEDIPELRVEGVSINDPEFKEAQRTAAAALSSIKAAEPELVALSAARKENDMALTAELHTEVKNLIDAGVTSALASEDFKKALNDSLKAALAAHKPEPKEPKAGDEAAEVTKLKADLAVSKKAQADAECKLALAERTRLIEEKAHEIKKAGNPLALSAIKAQLAKMETDEGFNERVTTLKNAKLSTDDPAGEPDPAQGDGKKKGKTPEQFLREEFKAKKIGHCTEDEYVRLNKNFVSPEDLN
jgi:hypothetical protein